MSKNYNNYTDITRFNFDMLIEGIHNEPIIISSHTLTRSAIFAYHQEVEEVGRVMVGGTDYQRAYWEGGG